MLDLSTKVVTFHRHGRLIRCEASISSSAPFVRSKNHRPPRRLPELMLQTIRAAHERVLTHCSSKVSQQPQALMFFIKISGNCFFVSLHPCALHTTR